MRLAVLVSTVCAAVALVWATAGQVAGGSWLLVLWVPWLIVSIYAWRNYRPSANR